MILLQYLLDCGSPPQANWSSRGEKENHALVSCSIIKLLCKLGETTSTAINAASDSTYLIFRVSMSHPARRLAIICGKRMTRRTMAVAIHNMAMLSGLRFLHRFRPRYN